MNSTPKHPALLNQLMALGVAINEEVECVNYGGCAVVAATVGKRLLALGVEVEVVTPVYHKDSIPANVRKKVTKVTSSADWSSNGLSRTHLAIRFRFGRKVYTWDSDGLCEGCDSFGHNNKYTTTDKFGDGLTIGECAAMANLAAGWNNSFHRESGIPMIRALTRQYIKGGA